MNFIIESECQNDFSSGHGLPKQSSDPHCPAITKEINFHLFKLK